MHPMTTLLPHALAVLAALIATGCAALPAAQMQLPDALAQQSPEPLRGLKAARRGEFELAGLRGRFERSASRLDLFETLSFDKVGASYSAAADGGPAVSGACRARQTGLGLGVFVGAPRPYEVQCRFDGGVAGQMSLAASDSAFGTRAGRSGRVDIGGVRLELKSVHRVQGSPLPLEAPIGYVFTHDGRAVGAVELNGTTPRLWRPTAGAPQHDAVTHAALALALLWDPAGN